MNGYNMIMFKYTLYYYREDSSFVLEEDASCPYLPYLVNHEPCDTSPADSETTLFEGRCESGK